VPRWPRTHASVPQARRARRLNGSGQEPADRPEQSCREDPNADVDSKDSICSRERRAQWIQGEHPNPARQIALGRNLSPQSAGRRSFRGGAKVTTPRMPSLLVGRWAQSRRCAGICAGATPIRLGVTRPQRSNDPVRLPPWPPSKAALGGSPSNHESPFRCAVPTTPADQAGTGVDCFPVRRAGVRIDTFEMLLRLYSRARRILNANLNLVQTQRCVRGHARLMARSIKALEWRRVRRPLDAIHRERTPQYVGHDAPLAGGDAWPGDSAVNASAAEGYSAQIRVIGVISATARSLRAELRARRQATRAG